MTDAQQLAAGLNALIVDAVRERLDDAEFRCALDLAAERNADAFARLARQ